MKLIEGFKAVGYKFLLLFVFILILLLIMSEVVENGFFPWINIIITFIVIDIFVSKILSIASGWKRLEKEFCLKKNITFKLKKYIKLEYGFIDKYSYLLHLLYTEDGILIKVFIFQRYSHKALSIPWVRISKIIIRKVFDSERKVNILDKIYDIGSNKRYAEIVLKDFTDIRIELPWTDEFRKNIPKDVNVDIRE